MTRTPPDMETAMSDAADFCRECGANLSLPGIEGIHIEGCSKAPPPTWHKPSEIQLAHKCYRLLSALGDPVAVAEALPELVEAAYELTGAVGDYRYNHETYGAGDITTNDAMDRMRGGSKHLYDLLAKLKARS